MNRPHVHPHALCESPRIGPGTRVGAFAHIFPGAVVGTDCLIGDHAVIENDVVVGDRVTVQCGVQLWDGLRVADDVFIGPNATFTNDKYPHTKQSKEVLLTVLEKGCSVGANSTILPGLTIGARSLVGAGAVVTRNVPPRAIVLGNPARLVGYSDTPKRAKAVAPAALAIAGERATPSSVRGVTIHRLKEVRDLRGNLSAGEFGFDIPFTPLRYFTVYGVPSKDVRGEHAHRRCAQFLVCVRGQVSLIVDDGIRSEEIQLDVPSLGVYLPPLVWGVQYKYSADAVLLVFASDPYDPADYIRNYDDFLQAVAAAPRPVYETRRAG